MHLLAMRRDTFEKTPELPTAMIEMWNRSKDIAYQYYEDPAYALLAWTSNIYKAQRERMAPLHLFVGRCDSCLIQPIDSQEFQTLRRLPRSRWVLYAIRRKSHDPLRQSRRIPCQNLLRVHRVHRHDGLSGAVPGSGGRPRGCASPQVQGQPRSIRAR